ncbi:hypothetical protein MMC13_000309 [Lambiella insularis]|nr:hypothetical protein [Lambiella insularis]
MSFLLPICFPSARKPHAPSQQLSEKAHLRQLRTQETACTIASTLLGAKSTGRDLDAQIHSIVHQAGGWYEALALAVIHALVRGFQDGKLVMNVAMKAAWQRATACADGVGGFVSKHPVWTAAIVTVVVLGVLVLLAPYVLEWVGFGALGPVEGEFRVERGSRGMG